MILELAVTAECNFIVTYNKNDFTGVKQFGIRVVQPQLNKVLRQLLI